MARGMNGEEVLKFEDVTVGYLPGGDFGYKRNVPVTVRVCMERLDRSEQYQTVTHEFVTHPLDFSITEAVWRPNRSDMIQSGPTPEALQMLLDLGSNAKYATGWDAGKVRSLIKLSAWHLNAMNAACEHQTVVYEDLPYRRPSLELTLPCPKSGYRYGSAWLIRELPADFVSRVRAIFPEEHRTDIGMNDGTALTITGKDNYGNPRQDFADKLFAADDAELFKIAEQRIWLSAYANNNPRSDYHWQADAAYDEAKRRGKEEIYTRAWEKAGGML